MDILFSGILAGAAIAASQTHADGFSIDSAAFQNGGSIPTKYTHHGVDGGKNISLPIRWSGAPNGTRSFALSIIDPHPVAKDWVHWFVINIPSNTTALPEGASGNSMPEGAVELDNTYGTRGYGGPEPPKGSGVHPYVVTVYALRVDRLDLKPATRLKDFLAALEGNVLATATTTGMYER